MGAPEREGGPPTGQAMPGPGASPSGAPSKQGEQILDVISDVQSQLEALRKAHAERQKALAALTAQREQIENAQKELDAKRGEIDEGSTRLRQSEETLAKRTKELDEREARIRQAAEKVAEHEQASGARTRQLEEDAQQGARLKAELEEVRKVSIERRDQIAALEKRLGELEGASNAVARAQALTAKLEDAKNAIESRDKRIAELSATLKDAESGVNAEEEKAEIRRLRARLVQADQRAQQAEARGLDLEGQLKKKTGELETASAATTQEAGKTAEALKKAKVELTKRTRELAEAKAKLESAERRAAESEQNSKASKGSAAAEKKAKEFQARVRELEDQLAKGAKGKGAPNEALAAAHERIRSLESELEAAQKKADDTLLREQIERLRTKLRVAEETASASEAPVEVVTRRRRLRRQKQLLREQTLKIRRAGDVLRERHEQCEQILAKRAQLAEAHQAIAEKRAKIEGAKAKVSAMWLVLGLVTVSSILAGLSWVISGQVAPSTYAARAVIIADPGARTPTDDELAAWQTYHEELARDPRLIENVADRLERRGIADLGQVAKLSQVITDQLVMQTPAPGRLEFELRERGSSRAQRVLDTYVVALASTANQNRVRRADGAATRVDVDAELIKGRADDTRIVTAGGIFGGSMFLTFVVGIGAWRKMAAAKERFERDHRVAILHDENEWVNKATSGD